MAKQGEFLNKNVIGGVLLAVAVVLGYLVYMKFIFESGEVVYKPDHSDIQGEYTETREVKLILKVSNPVPRVREQAKIVVYVPQETNSYQLLQKMRVSHSYTEQIDNLGNRTITFDFVDVQPRESFLISIVSELKTAVASNKDPLLPRLYADEETGGVTPLPNQQLVAIDGVIPEVPVSASNSYIGEYLQDGPVLQINEPAVQQFAASLQDDDEIKTVENILAWVGGNIGKVGEAGWSSYNDAGAGLDSAVETVANSTVGGDRVSNALSVLRSRKAEGWDKAAFITALARSNQIATRPVVGYRLYNNNNEPQIWVEFYIDGKWRVADIDNMQIQSNPSDYVAVRVFSVVPNRVINSVEQMMYDYYGVNIIKVNGSESS